MKQKIFYLLFLCMVGNTLLAGDVKPTKNVIIMIPDGTSLSVLSASRWLQIYRNDGTSLQIDPYLCGTVTTFSSNAPIGDSAPTTSCYMTGIAEQAGNVSIYPVVDPGNDLIKLNPDSAYQPLATILEAMKIEQKKAAGLVFTCIFPHATPADCSSHTYNRNDYKSIAPQMAYNNLDVVIGGGSAYITDDIKKHFTDNGTAYINNDKTAMLNFSGNKLWALFGDHDMPYDIDRDTAITPSLAQMTRKALELLHKNKKGFFLMVEGSKIDWAAHANDPIAIMTEYLAFDKAVGAAIDFAKKDGNTTVIILPDHGNSGFSIGKRDMKKSYTQMTLEDLFGSVSKYERTATGLEKILLNTKPNEIKSVFREFTGLELTEDEVKLLLKSKNYKAENYMEVSNSENMTHYITQILNDHSTFGFTTGGHTGEEVFLAMYHPKGDILTGNIRNKDINAYLFQVAGLKRSLNQLTSEIYAKHTDVFRGLNYSIENQKSGIPQLVVKKGNKTLIIPAYSSVVTLNGTPLNLGSVAVYIDKINTFYLPAHLNEVMQ
ncbi:MAG: alkaline phosphatase [Paludibacter sp.]|nr:alkaline phosphatase [Paludibacter sp.]